MPTQEPASPAVFVRAHPGWSATGAGLLLALALVTLLGGWARSTPPGAAQVEAGSEIDATPFRVRLDRASAQYELAGSEAEEGRALLVVEGRIELTTPLPADSATLVGAFTADLATSYDQFGDPAEEPEPSVRVLPDGSNLLGLGPGLVYDVAITFVVDEGSVPDQLVVTLRGHTERASRLDGELTWSDSTPVARVRMDVAPLPAVRPEPEGF